MSYQAPELRFYLIKWQFMLSQTAHVCVQTWMSFEYDMKFGYILKVRQTKFDIAHKFTTV